MERIIKYIFFTSLFSTTAWFGSWWLPTGHRAVSSFSQHSPGYFWLEHLSSIYTIPRSRHIGGSNSRSYGMEKGSTIEWFAIGQSQYFSLSDGWYGCSAIIGCWFLVAIPSLAFDSISEEQWKMLCLIYYKPLHCTCRKLRKNIHIHRSPQPCSQSHQSHCINL